MNGLTRDIKLLSFVVDNWDFSSEQLKEARVIMAANAQVNLIKGN